MSSFIVANNAESTITDDPLASGALTLNVANGNNFPSTYPFLITLWNDATYPDPSDFSYTEIVKCTGRTGNALTIVRAQEDTADVEHANGERVAMLITAGIFNDATNGISTKLDGIEALADVTSTNETSHANVLVDGDLPVDSTLVFTDNTGNDVSNTKHGYVPKATDVAGQFLKADGTWGTAAGGGDMLASTYDPTPIAGDVFAMSNMVEGATTKILTATERTDLAYLTSRSDFDDYTESPMIVTGGEITVGTNAGTFKVAALTALIRKTDSAIGELAYVTKTEEDNIAITLSCTHYYVVVNYNGGSPTVGIISSLQNFNDNIPIGSVMKDISDDVHYISGCFRLQGGVAKLHYRAFELYNLLLSSGNTIAYSGTNNFTMTEGVMYEGINRLTQNAYNSATVTFVRVHNDNAGGWTEVAANVIDFAHYDLADGSGNLGNVGTAKYGCHWVYRHAGECGHVYVLYGTDSYSLAEAEVAQVPTGPDHLTQFGCLIGKIIAPQAGGSFSIQMVTDTTFTGVSVATHNDLGGLNAGDYQHLTASEKTLFDTIDSGADVTADNAPQAHDLDSHNSCTLVELSADISDATLIDTGDSRLSDARTPTAHKSTHVTGGSDVIDNAVSEGNSGLMTGADKKRLDDIETGADVTDSVNIASSIVGTAAKATPVDADTLPLIDSADASSLKEVLWSQVKATLKTYFDTLYNLYSHPNHSGDVTSAGDGATTIATGAVDIAMHSATGTPGATNYYRGDNTWSVPAGGTYANASEINTGTEAAKANTPDALAGSIFGTKSVVIKVIDDDTALTTGDGKTHFTIPVELNGMNLVSVGAHVYTASSSGLPNFQVHNATGGADMLSTAITIDASENDSKDATTAAVIDAAQDDVATGDVIRFDCDTAGTDTAGMEIRMSFRLP